jgi:ribonuclease PH
MKYRLRPLHFQPRYLPHAEGSCLVQMGRTKVLCVASVENELPPHAKEKGTGWITAEYAMLPRAGEKRSPRSRVNSGGRVQEISRLIGRSLRAAVDLSLLGERTITIDCDVICADGGTRTAAINGGWIALVQALLGLRKKGELAQWPLQHIVGAVSLGLLPDKVVLDMAYQDDQRALADVNMVMNEKGEIIEIQGTAEGKAFSLQQLNQLLRIAESGVDSIREKQKKAVGRLPPLIQK